MTPWASTAIEQVARAICRQANIDDGYADNATLAGSIDQGMWRNHAEQARAAIAALSDEDLRSEIMRRKFNSLYVRAENACWQWTGPLDKCNGYGYFYDGSGKTWGAHRYSFVRHRGQIPEGLVIDHLCRNRACVNPDHMRLVTNAENVLCGEGPSARHARMTVCKRGHEFTEANTYISTDGYRSCRQCRIDRTREHRDRKKSGLATVSKADEEIGS